MYTKSLYSLAILTAYAIAGNACATGPGPNIKDDNTVTLELFSTSNELFETISIGNIGNCHNLDTAAHTFIQAVGQNLFHRNLHIITFSSSDCNGGSQAWDLTNNGKCFGNGENWLSIKLDFA
jgi:hypothetical protein